MSEFLVTLRQSEEFAPAEKSRKVEKNVAQSEPSTKRENRRRRARTWFIMEGARRRELRKSLSFERARAQMYTQRPPKKARIFRRPGGTQVLAANSEKPAHVHLLHLCRLRKGRPRFASSTLLYTRAGDGGGEGFGGAPTIVGNPSAVLPQHPHQPITDRPRFSRTPAF